MKKDYIPVVQEASLASESDFIQEFWTKRWDQVGQPVNLVDDIGKREEAALIKRQLMGLPKSARILDGGCGLGQWTIFLQSLGFDAVGLDLSEKTIARLNEMFPEASFVPGDIRHTHFEDGSFDAYLSWGTFEHFESGLGEPLIEAFRLLKAGGLLFVSVPYQNRRHLRRDRGALWTWDDNYDRDCGYTRQMRFYQWRLTRCELQRELEIRGFRVLEVHAIHKMEGTRRMLRHDLKLDPSSFVGRVLAQVLNALTPAEYAAHMLLAVAEKRA